MSTSLNPVIQKGPLLILRWHVLRRLLDLSYASICSQLEHARREDRGPGPVLDFGAGEAVWKRYFDWKGAEPYTTIDAHSPADHTSLAELPPRYRPKTILLIEVLEHLEKPAELLRELARLSTPETQLWLSVPFQARVHSCPQDYQRWTDLGLAQLLNASGWIPIAIQARGNDWTLLASKWIFFLSRRLYLGTTAFPAGLLWLITVPVAALLGHLSLLLHWGFEDEAIGWFVRASPKRASYPNENTSG